MGFTLNIIEGRSFLEERFASKYSITDYPFQNYREIKVQKHKFRVSAEASKQEYTQNNILYVFSIYEEKENNGNLMLVQRYLRVIDSEQINEQFSFEYQNPGSKEKISCHVFYDNNSTQSSKFKSGTNRKPARNIK